MLILAMAMQLAAGAQGTSASIPFAELARFRDWPENGCRIADPEGQYRLELGSHIAADRHRTMYDVLVFRTRANLGLPVGTQVVTNGLYPQNGRVISVRNGWTSVAFDGQVVAALWYDDSATVTFRPADARGNAGLAILSASSTSDHRALLADMLACHQEGGL